MEAPKYDIYIFKGITFYSKENNPEHIKQMFDFCYAAFVAGVSEYIHSIYFDYNSDICQFDFVVNEQYIPFRKIIDVAKQYLQIAHINGGNYIKEEVEDNKENIKALKNELQKYKDFMIDCKLDIFNDLYKLLTGLYCDDGTGIFEDFDSLDFADKEVWVGYCISIYKKIRDNKKLIFFNNEDMA